MKTIESVVIIPFITATLCILSLYSCTKGTPTNNKTTTSTVRYCDTAHCHGAATCDTISQSCLCAPSTGYEGPNCDIEIRRKFLSTYVGPERCAVTGQATDSVRITASSANILAITISGLGSRSPISAIVSGTTRGLDTFTIPHQTISLSGGGTELIYGSGGISGSNQSLTLNFYEGQSLIHNCTFEGDR